MSGVWIIRRPTCLAPHFWFYVAEGEWSALASDARQFGRREEAQAVLEKHAQSARCDPNDPPCRTVPLDRARWCDSDVEWKPSRTEAPA